MRRRRRLATLHPRREGEPLKRPILDLDELDTFIRVHGAFPAMRHVMERHHLGLDEAQDLVLPRVRALHPEPTLDEQEAAARSEFLSLTPEGTLEVRAAWDGDSEGWFVVLEVVRGPDARVARLATLRSPGGDLRLFAGPPRWPEAELAQRLGREFARALNVPFTFDDRDGPPPRDLSPPQNDALSLPMSPRR